MRNSIWLEYFKQYARTKLVTRLETSKWNYTDDICVLGFKYLYDTLKDEDFKSIIVDLMAKYIMAEDGTVIHLKQSESNIDNISCGKSLYVLSDLTSDGRYRKAIDLVYAMIERYPRTKEGNFWHKNIYPHQVWLDGLYMGQPFYARYIIDNGKKEKWDDIIDQFKSADAILWDEKLGLYKHGYDESRMMEWSDKETGCSPSVWLRAEGWYLMALCDVYELAKDNTPRAGELIEILKKALCGLMPYQLENRMFLQVVDRKDFEGNYAETSGSAMVAYALMKGSRLGMLPDKCWQQGSDLIDGIRDTYLVREKDGSLVLRGICASAGLGPGPNNRPDRDGTVEYYVQRERQVDDNQHGVATAMMAVNEQLIRNP